MRGVSRRSLPVLGFALAGAPARAQTQRAAGDFWFDPTQLPSFTGTVERYLLNPRGETDALLFREGPQVVFPPDASQAVHGVAAPGRPIVVWGIRARNAPVITMLAFAASSDATPQVVERLYWRFGARVVPEAAQALQFRGVVKVPYYTPQGDIAGAILDDGSVVMLPRDAVDSFKDLLKPGARLAVAGHGHAEQSARAVLAERLGEAPDSLRPVPMDQAQR